MTSIVLTEGKVLENMMNQFEISTPGSPTINCLLLQVCLNSFHFLYNASFYVTFLCLWAFFNLSGIYLYKCMTHKDSMKKSSVDTVLAAYALWPPDDGNIFWSSGIIWAFNDI